MLTIAGVEIGEGWPCRFVAEVSNNHNGALDRALRLIDAAKEAGADLVKFQCFTPDELVQLRGDGPAPEPWGSQGWTMRTLYEKAQTPHAWFPNLVEHCREVGLPWFSSVFGVQSLALLESLDCPAYKFASIDRSHIGGRGGLRDLCGKTFRPIILSSPTPDPRGDLCLYCPPGYPQTSFHFLREVFRRPLDGWVVGDPLYGGFSFHGTDAYPCVVAATLGAKMIEAHLQLDDEPSELEANVSLGQRAFAEIISIVRVTEAMIAD